MASVSIVYRKDKINKKGLAPIHFRIIKDRKVSNISSGILIPEDSWDAEKQKIKGKHLNSARLNSLITNKFAELQDNVFEYETNHKSTTTSQLKESIYGKKPLFFFAFAIKANEPYLKDDKIGTYDKNKAIISKLSLYADNVNLTFQDITPDYLSKFQRYLKDTLNNKTNTANNSLKFINQMFKQAYNQDLIEHNIIPFNKFKITSDPTERMYLSEDELCLIENCTITPNTRMSLHRDMFVFAAYAGGVRVSDMLQLKWKHFDGVNLNITMKKTKGQISIKVPTRALAIMEKYKVVDGNSNDYIFPMLSNELNIKDARAVDSALSSATAYINKNLKFIAEKISLDKPLSFHISRHTWATRALRKGMSIDKVSKLMGHSQLKETQIYAKIINSELDKAMDIFND